MSLYQDKQPQLESIRKECLRRHMVKLIMQYLNESKKPTKFFCQLEKNNYQTKTIKRIQLNDGTLIHDQETILQTVANYYANLFDQKTVDDIELTDLVNNKDDKRLSNIQSKNLEGKLTVEELGQALKDMKNGKTPGMDGFPAEFFKVFWGKIKHFMLRALNCSFKHNCLSESLRTCVITCLPKGDKPREFLKNWRLLSMLSVVYKILSASLANRMKPILTNLVSETQCGFVPGRFIGDNTRLIYDVMHYLNKNNKVGLLILIDFEKAFDSISWVFINKVLKFFNFGETFIKWVTILNSKIKGTVIQCGNLSKFVNIKRGCRQGDPISPYLFILCGEILKLLILKYNC